MESRSGVRKKRRHGELEWSKEGRKEEKESSIVREIGAGVE
jgi:hypothetical protein